MISDAEKALLTLQGVRVFLSAFGGPWCGWSCPRIVGGLQSTVEGVGRDKESAWEQAAAAARAEGL